MTAAFCPLIVTEFIGTVNKLNSVSSELFTYGNNATNGVAGKRLSFAFYLIFHLFPAFTVLQKSR